MTVTEDFLRQVHAELLTATGEALGILTAALARQVDATRLTDDLRHQIEAARQTGQVSSTALRLATLAMAGAEAESAHQTPDRH